MTTMTRLHITPFTSDLLPAILGPSLLESAQNISYHHIQTFPEKAYGYVDLPSMDAKKIKKKLNDATLKGKKIKIDEARPKKRKHDEGNEASQPRTRNVDREDGVPKTKKRSNSERDVLPGRDISPGRKVKRGWTEVESKSQGRTRVKSGRQPAKYSENEELLFRTQIPPNKTEITSKEKKRAKNNTDRQVIHEFEKSTAQPSFLKGSVENGPRQDLHYVDGQGWTDEQGKVVEQEARRTSTKGTTASQSIKVAISRSREKAASPNASENSSASASEELSDRPKFPNSDLEDTSSSGSSDESDSGNQQESDQAEKQTNQPGTHPLEALFKKPTKPSSQDIAKPSLEVSTTFSFFETGDEADTGEETNIPGTPFTSQDFRARGLRSAAPTPDTAHPSRFNSYGTPELDDSEDGNEEAGAKRGSSEMEATPSQRKSRDDHIQPQQQQQSDFEKQFWEQRGDNNRAWKARRRTVLKEKRQRENRARRPKNW